MTTPAAAVHVPEPGAPQRARKVENKMPKEVADGRRRRNLVNLEELKATLVTLSSVLDRVYRIAKSQKSVSARMSLPSG